MIRSLFRFGLPTGVQGIAMNIGGVFLLRFIGSLEHSGEAQAALRGGYTELFSLITWTSVGLMGAAATVAGQNLGADKPERALDGVHDAACIGLGGGGAWSECCSSPSPGRCSAIFGMTDERVAGIGTQLLALPGRVGVLHQRRAHLHRRAPGHRRHAEPALHLPHFAGRRAARPSARCFRRMRGRSSPPTSGWRLCSVMRRGAG